MRKLKLVIAGFAVAALGLVGAGAPAEAAGTVTGQNVWCC